MIIRNKFLLVPMMALGLCLGIVTDANAQFFGSNNFEGQRNAIDSKIDSALRRGQLQTVQAQNLRVMLSTNRDLQSKAMADGNISPAEAADLTNGINGVETGLATLLQHNINLGIVPIANSPVTPSVANPGGHYRGRNSDLRDLDSQRASMESRINRSMRAGRLSPPQVSSMQVMLNSNVELQKRAMLDGSLSAAEYQEILTGINALGTSLVTLETAHAATVPAIGGAGWGNSQYWGSAGFNVDITNRLSALSSRIESGRASGQLRGSEYRSLQKELTQLHDRNLQPKRHWQQSALNAAISRLEQRVTREMNDRDRRYR